LEVNVCDLTLPLEQPDSSQPEDSSSSRSQSPVSSQGQTTTLIESSTYSPFSVTEKDTLPNPVLPEMYMMSFRNPMEINTFQQIIDYFSSSESEFHLDHLMAFYRQYLELQEVVFFNIAFCQKWYRTSRFYGVNYNVPSVKEAVKKGLLMPCLHLIPPTTFCFRCYQLSTDIESGYHPHHITPNDRLMGSRCKTRSELEGIIPHRNLLPETWPPTLAVIPGSIETLEHARLLQTFKIPMISPTPFKDRWQLSTYRSEFESNFKMTQDKIFNFLCHTRKLRRYLPTFRFVQRSRPEATSSRDPVVPTTTIEYVGYQPVIQPTE